MGLRERHNAWQRWLTPRRRRRIGGTVMAAWAVGVVVHPGQYLLYVAVTGVIILMGGWQFVPESRQ